MNDIDWKTYWKYVRMSSMLNWWPKIKDVDVPKPKTEILELTTEELAQLAGYEKLKMKTYTKVIEFASKIGFPLFIRTDQYSAKHHYKDTCYVPDLPVLMQHIATLLQEASNVNMVGLPTRALVFREFIELNYGFKAFHDLPIAKERRYMIRDGEVVRHFPYWPEEAIRFWSVEEPKNWRATLKKLNAETEEEVKLLTKYAEKIAKAIEGFWSVDFAQAKNGTWYLIDMGRGEISWTPEKQKEREEQKKELEKELKEFLELVEGKDEGEGDENDAHRKEYPHN
ncbi:MAG: ATP-grasp domain-containing protein [Deltaproteobacteria bacterium]|nr:ATP-grasp domain-containing protein [Deltaproteobacteria bacterium]